MARSVLGGSGYVTPADSIYDYNYMTGPGRVAVAGARFVALKVIAVTGGTAPTVVIRNGMSDNAPSVRSVAAVAANTIDQRGAPDLCDAGIWLSVTGNPVKIEVEVLFR